MLKKWIAPAVLGRFMLPLFFGFALLGFVVTEITYQRARTTLAGGIALTDARIQSASLLQALTDHEVATRLYVLNGDAAAAIAQRRNAEATQHAQQSTRVLVQQLDPGGALLLQGMDEQVEAQFARVEGWRTLVDAGQRGAALEAAAGDTGQQARARLRQEFDTLLRHAASLQTTARVSLFDALMLNRLTIHLLIALTVLAMLLLVRSQRAIALNRAQEHDRLEGLVANRTAMLNELAGHLVTAREDERARLARELHDELGGLLTAMKLDFARLRRFADLPEAAKERLAAIDARLNEGIALKRGIVENLRPSSLDLLGLGAALDLLCREVSASLGVPVHAELEPVRVAKEAELTIYRLVQESLTNISKHAQCAAVQVSLRPLGAAWVEVQVADDGVGFDPAASPTGSHGLLGMRFRVKLHGGRLTVHSAPSTGTLVRAELPALPPIGAEGIAA